MHKPAKAGIARCPCYGGGVNRSTIFLPFAILALTAGCASSEGYPSLAMRDAERVSGTFSPTTEGDGTDQAPPPEIPADAALSTRIDGLLNAAKAAHARFMDAAPRARRLASAAGGVGSDSWASAQVALADLESQRSQAAIALSTLDEMHVEGVTTNTLPGIVTEARDTVISLIGEEDTLLSQLRAKVRG